MKYYIVIIGLWVMSLSGCSGEGRLHSHDRECEHDEQDAHAHDVEAEAEHPDEIIFTRAQAEAAGLQVWIVTPETFGRVVKASGEIQTPQSAEITLAATASGIVSFALPSIADGMPVAAGETIANIASGHLPDGDPGLRIKLAYETAQKEYRRAEELSRHNIISTKEFEQVRLACETARIAYEAQAADRTPSGVRIASPVSGFVRESFVGQGEYVTVGRPIATIVRNSRLRLRADLPVKYYGNIRHLRSAHFKIPGDTAVYRLREMNGRLLSAGQVAGVSGVGVPVTFEFDNTAGLLSGSFVEVYLLFEPQEQVIAIPASAVTEEQGLYFVYLRVDDEGYRKQEVTLGADDGKRIQALSGLKAGDVLVTEGAYRVKLAASGNAIPEGHTHSH
ncbi:MAG: efflux RND transporter periplasmic adaptor subunit [Tannerella sp.]|jgi:RND family efflux transporter MFP subunit|nr:efflux RND transporter periplasmic adaptor subunit [Tannerella sp.]